MSDKKRQDYYLHLTNEDLDEVTFINNGAIVGVYASLVPAVAEVVIMLRPVGAEQSDIFLALGRTVIAAAFTGAAFMATGGGIGKLLKDHERHKAIRDKKNELGSFESEETKHYSVLPHEINRMKSKLGFFHLHF